MWIGVSCEISCHWINTCKWAWTKSKDIRKIISRYRGSLDVAFILTTFGEKVRLFLYIVYVCQSVTNQESLCAIWVFCQCQGRSRWMTCSVLGESNILKQWFYGAHYTGWICQLFSPIRVRFLAFCFVILSILRVNHYASISFLSQIVSKLSIRSQFGK